MRIKCGNCKSEYEPRWISISRPCMPYNPSWWWYTTYDTDTNTTITTTTTGNGYYQVYPYIPWEQYPYNYSGYYDYSCPVCGYGANIFPSTKKYIPAAGRMKPTKKPYDWRPYDIAK